MANTFSGKKVGNGVEDDFLGGGSLFDSDIYAGATIKVAYIGESASSKAQSVNFVFVINGQEMRETVWVTNRNGDASYKDKKTGEERGLPGFNQVNALALLVLGKELGDLETEERTVKIYDFDAKKELPQAVNCFVELHGETVTLAVQKQIIDKTAKNDRTGSYDPTGETREVNEVVKFFNGETTVTIDEVSRFIKDLGGNMQQAIDNNEVLKAIGRMEEGDFAGKWLTKNKGETYNKAKGAGAGGNSGKSFKGSGGTNKDGAKKAGALFDD